VIGDGSRTGVGRRERTAGKGRFRLGFSLRLIKNSKNQTLTLILRFIMVLNPFIHLKIQFNKKDFTKIYLFKF
jgi:hypothetical protein